MQSVPNLLQSRHMIQTGTETPVIIVLALGLLEPLLGHLLPPVQRIAHSRRRHLRAGCSLRSPGPAASHPLRRRGVTSDLVILARSSGTDDAAAIRDPVVRHGACFESCIVEGARKTGEVDESSKQAGRSTLLGKARCRGDLNAVKNQLTLPAERVRVVSWVPNLEGDMVRPGRQLHLTIDVCKRERRSHAFRLGLIRPPYLCHCVPAVYISKSEMYTAGTQWP